MARVDSGLRLRVYGFRLEILGSKIHRISGLEFKVVGSPGWILMGVKGDDRGSRISVFVAGVVSDSIPKP